MWGFGHRLDVSSPRKQQFGRILAFYGLAQMVQALSMVVRDLELVYNHPLVESFGFKKSGKITLSQFSTITPQKSKPKNEALERSYRNKC